MTEEWVDIIGGNGLYQVSSLGLVAKIEDGIRVILPMWKSKKGYMYVDIYYGEVRKHKTVHRLVGIHHIPNPDNLPQINHKNTDKSDNRKVNLEWATNLRNHAHAIENGIQKGFQPRTLTYNDILNIMECVEQGLNVTTISRKLNFPFPAIREVVCGKNWKSVTNYPLRKGVNRYSKIQ